MAKYIALSLDDSRVEAIASVIVNPTCKKILNTLADKEMSESDLSQNLKIPLNTTEYNIKKLIDAGLIERSKQSFWSVKGKKIITYRVVNKDIIISPRSKISGILPAIGFTILIALGIKLFVPTNEISSPDLSKSVSSGGLMTSVGSASGAASSAATTTGAAGVVGTVPSAGAASGASIVSAFNLSPWAWFLLGAWAALLIIVLWSMIGRKNGN